MPTIGAASLQTEGTQRQSHIVADNEQTALIDILLVKPIPDGIKPVLWRVSSYSSPTFPKPTIKNLSMCLTVQ